MSYTLKFKNQAGVDPIGKAPITVNVGAINNTSTDLTLTGKGAANYGPIQQDNLLLLLENFADTVEPANPTVGQLWYDASVQTLKVLIDAMPKTWKALGGVQATAVNAGPPSPATIGDVWFSSTGTTSGFLYVYTGIGRYPTTGTSIGGWDQIQPSVEVFAGREEYDLVRQLLDQLIGTPVSTFGAGAIGRSVTNLTDFASLDNDLRTKYKAKLPLDANVLYSSGTGIDIDREITRQAESSTLFYFNDSNSSSDGFIGGLTGGVPDPLVPGSIMVNGVLRTMPSGALSHSMQVEDSFIIYDQSNSLSLITGPYLIAKQLSYGGQWQYDDNSAWVNFTPTSAHLAIGTISTLQNDLADTYPIDKTAFLWAHAVPLIGTKIEHLKVEPNSNDWDTLLAAAKYAINRLEVPANYTRFISSQPFVSDGRPLPASLIGLDSATDVRYPSAARRSSRKIAAVAQVQNFAETINALNTAISNKFSLRGINGVTGTNPDFASTTAITVHCAPPSVGLSGVVSSSTGTGTVRTKFRFTSMDDMNRFLGSGGALQLELSHVGGTGIGDTNLRSMLTDIGTWRITADKTRVFGQASMTITRPIVNIGIWNGNAPGKTLASQASSGGTMQVVVYRVSNVEFDVLVQFSVGSVLTGTTALTIKSISDTETYMPGSLQVFSKPQAFVPTDIVDPM